MPGVSANKKKEKCNNFRSSRKQRWDTSLEERKEAHENFCQKLFSDLSADADIEDAIRVGRPTQDRPRLLRVSFQSFESKLRVMRTSKELRNLENYKRVYINPDRTRLQQSIDKRLLEELKERKEAGDGNLVIHREKIVYCHELKNFPTRF